MTPRFEPDKAYKAAEDKFQRGRLNEALADIAKALKEVDKSAADTTWKFRLLKSEVLIWQGKSQDALELLRPEILQEPTSDKLIARRNVLTGMAASNLQQLDLADHTFTETEKMRGVESPEVMGDLLLGEGKIAAMRRDPRISELKFRHALQIAQEHGLTFLAGKALGNLGMLQMQQHRYADAVDQFNASLITAQKLGAQASIVRTAGNLGWAYFEMGDLERASEFFNESEKKSAELGMIEDQKIGLMNIAAIAFVRRDFLTAESDYKRALELARSLSDQFEVARSLTDLAELAIEKADFDLAEKYNNEALALEVANADHETDMYSRLNQAQIFAGKQNFAKAESVLKSVIREVGADPNLQAQALSALADVDAKGGYISAATTHYRDAILMTENARAVLGREEFKLSYPANSKNIYDNYIDFLMSRGRTNDAFEVADSYRSSALMDGLGIRKNHTRRAINTTETQHVSARIGRVILSYWLGQSRSYLWVFGKGVSQCFVLPKEEEIRPLVERYRSRLTGEFPLDGPDLTGETLFDILVRPAEKLILPGSSVAVASNGVLCGLNFETLVVRAPTLHYWIEDVSVTNISSIALLEFGAVTETKQSRGVRKTLLLIGNPTAPDYYPPLPHASEEMRLIAENYRTLETTVLSGAAATPAAYFKANPENYALIHFVAHGTASRLSPLDSAVVLSEDGRTHNLYARDIAGFPIRAELVTISACDSAGARIYSAEGLVGLSWAFLRAGAHKVIAALWEVNDASTPDLMKRFYTGMASGEQPEVALRAAKLNLLRSKSIYRRPFFWAPFVVYQGIKGGNQN